MALLFKLIFKSLYFGTTVLFPAFKAFDSVKNSRVDKLWINYFFIMGLLWLLQSTILFPVILLFDLICTLIVPVITILFSLWMFHPEYQGALLIEHLLIKPFELIYFLTQPFLGKILGILGVPERVIQRSSSHETKRPVTENETSSQQERTAVEKDKSM